MTWADVTRADAVSWEVGRAEPSRGTVSRGHCRHAPGALEHPTVSGAQRSKTRAWPLLSYQTHPCRQPPLPWPTGQVWTGGQEEGGCGSRGRGAAIGLRCGSRMSMTDRGQGLSRCSAVKRGRVRCGTPRFPPALTWLLPTPMSGWPGAAQEPHLGFLHSAMTWRCPRPSHNPPEEGRG